MNHFLLFGVLSIIFLGQNTAEAKKKGEDHASGSAMYRISFKNKWTPKRHPKDYPYDAHLSPPVFASHSSDYTMWAPGMMASKGVQTVAETGAPNILVSELDDAGDYVLDYVIGTAMFDMDKTPKQVIHGLKVDADHPYISGVSMLAPSPDWFGGIRDISVVSDDGYWYDSITVRAFAYDAGTDSGEEYTSENMATMPQENIFRVPGEVFSSKGKKAKSVLTIKFVRVG